MVVYNEKSYEQMDDLGVNTPIFRNIHIAPDNGWLEDDPFLLGWPIFRCKLAVSFREGSFWLKL